LAARAVANHGFRRALPFVCAMPLGWGALLTLCSLGLGALVLALPLLGWTIKLAGVAYLLWLAAKLARSRQLGEADAARLNVTFWQGAALQFVNIKAWMLALAIVSGWIAGQEAPALRFALVLPLMLAYAFVSNLTYALAGSLLRDWLRGPDGTGQRLAMFNRIMAAVLALTAVWMLWR
jgi:threonine/homoserine/homoserine lactone efflux protein